MATRTRKHRPASSSPNGTTPAPAPVSPPALSPDRFIPGGLRLEFEFNRDKCYLRVELIICPAAAWAEDPRSQRYEWTWSKTLLGDGWVAACRFAPRHEEDHGHSDFDPEYLAVLRRFRAELLGWLDAQPWIGHTTLQMSNNGAMSFDCEVVDERAECWRPVVTLDVHPNEMSC